MQQYDNINFASFHDCKEERNDRQFAHNLALYSCLLQVLYFFGGFRKEVREAPPPTLFLGEKKKKSQKEKKAAGQAKQNHPSPHRLAQSLDPPLYLDSKDGECYRVH